MPAAQATLPADVLMTKRRKLRHKAAKDDLPIAFPSTLARRARQLMNQPCAAPWPMSAIGPIATGAILTASRRFRRALRTWLDLRLAPPGRDDTGQLQGGTVKRACTGPDSARDAGQSQLEAGDDAAAERSFDEAVRLGLDDIATLLGRGWSRVALERYAEAEADFDAALNAGASDAAARPKLGLAAYFRGIAREQQDRLEGARADYTSAIGFGFADADVYRRRASVTLGLGLKAEARQDADRARQLAPDDTETKALEAALAEAGA